MKYAIKLHDSNNLVIETLTQNVPFNQLDNALNAMDKFINELPDLSHRIDTIYGVFSRTCVLSASHIVTIYVCEVRS